MSSISRFLSTTGNLDEDLENLSPNGAQKIRVICQDLINGGGGGGNVATVNNIPPVNGNVSLTSADIPEQTNLYYTDNRADARISNAIPTRGDLLTRDAVGPTRLPIGTNGQCLKSNGNDPTWDQINLQEILNMTPSERLNFSIPGNSSVNMLDWLMNNSNIFDNLITPNNLPDINPFFWGTRGDADYGQWKIQNNNANAANIDRVNIIHGANFIIWQFIRTLINNIMDDNLNDGTALVRPLGINHNQQAGADAQIINTTINNLGRFRTLTAGTNITITQNDSTITINSTGGGASSLNDLNDVVITNPANNDILIFDGNNYINSQRLAEAELNIQQNEDAINALQNQQERPTYNPAPNTGNSQTISYVEADYPLVSSTYTDAAVLLPLDGNGDNAINNTLFFNCGDMDVVPGVGAYNGMTDLQAGRRLYNATDIFPIGTDTSNANYCRPGSERININMTNVNNGNGMTPGTYLYRCAGPDNFRGGASVWGLKNVNLVTNAMTITTGIPTDDADWDRLLTEFTIPDTPTNYTITTNTTYFMIVIYVNFPGYFSGATILSTNQTVTVDYVTPTNITISNNQNGFNITNVLGKNAESWRVNIDRLTTWFNVNTVSKVIRGTNSLFLTNTQFTDTEIRTNNAQTVYRISNSTNSEFWLSCGSTRTSFRGDIGLGTNLTVINQDKILASGTTYTISNAANNQNWLISSNTNCQVANNLTIGAAGRIVYANNRVTQATFSDVLNNPYVLNIANINTWYLLEPPPGLTLTNFGGAAFSTQGINNQLLRCEIAGTYKICICISVNYADNNEVLIRCGRDATAPPNNLYIGSYILGNAFGNYHTYTSSFIATIAQNEYINIFVRAPVGVGGADLSTIFYNITCENMLIS